MSVAAGKVTRGRGIGGDADAGGRRARRRELVPTLQWLESHQGGFTGRETPQHAAEMEVEEVQKNGTLRSWETPGPQIEKG